MDNSEFNRNDNNYIEEMIDLIQHVPIIRKELNKHFQHLKVIYQKDITHYRNIKKILNFPARHYAKGDIEIEIKKFGKTVWIASLKNPENGQKNNSKDIFKLFPLPLLNFVVNAIPHPGDTISQTHVILDDLPNRVFNIHFQKKRNHYISGYLSEQKENYNADLSQADETKTVDMEKLYTLFEYLVTDKALYQHVVPYFDRVWKPIVDARI